METERAPREPIRELPIVAGHLALDFANTIDDPDGPARFDHIATYPALLRWSTRVAVLTTAEADRLAHSAAAHPRKAQQALRRAHRLRRLIGTLFTDLAAGGGSAQAGEQWIELRPYLADAVAHAQLAGTDDQFHLSWPIQTDDHAGPLHPIVYAATSLLTSPDLGRVKRCAGCPWLFLDHSRNSSRRWCAMNDCGTHEKIQRYVARRAARRANANVP